MSIKSRQVAGVTTLVGFDVLADDYRRLVEHAVADFVKGVAPDRVVLDLKPGTKKMSYAILCAAERGCRILNLEPTFLDDRRNHPARPTPRCPEIDQNRHLGFEDLGLEVVVGYVGDQSRHVRLLGW